MADEGTRAANPNRIPFPFDPRPKFVRAMIKEKRLKRIDGDVLLDLLRYRNPYRNSCWRAAGKIAGELGVSKRTVQRSLRRLSEAGLIEQIEVRGRDPDEHNRTGWRIVFVFLAGPDYQPGPGPDRRPPRERKVWVRADRPRDDNLSSPPPPPCGPDLPSPPMSEMASGPMAILSSNYGARDSARDGLELDGETPPPSSSPRACDGPPSAEVLDDDDSASLPGQDRPPARPAPIAAAELPAAALVVAEADTNGEQPPAAAELPAGIAEASAIAEAHLAGGRDVARKIRAEADRCEHPERWPGAVWMAADPKRKGIRDPFAWMLPIVRKGLNPIEADEARKRVLKHAEANEAARAQHAAALARAAPEPNAGEVLELDQAEAEAYKAQWRADMEAARGRYRPPNLYGDGGKGARP